MADFKNRRLQKVLVAVQGPPGVGCVWMALTPMPAR